MYYLPSTPSPQNFVHNSPELFVNLSSRGRSWPLGWNFNRKYNRQKKTFLCMTNCIVKIIFQKRLLPSYFMYTLRKKLFSTKKVRLATQAFFKLMWRAWATSRRCFCPLDKKRYVYTVPILPNFCAQKYLKSRQKFN